MYAYIRMHRGQFIVSIWRSSALIGIVNQRRNGYPDRWDTINLDQLVYRERTESMIRRNVELSWFQEQYRLWILFSVDYAIVIDRRVEKKNAKIDTFLERIISIGWNSKILWEIFIILITKQYLNKFYLIVIVIMIHR